MGEVDVKRSKPYVLAALLLGLAAFALFMVGHYTPKSNRLAQIGIRTALTALQCVIFASYRQRVLPGKAGLREALASPLNMRVFATSANLLGVAFIVSVTVVYNEFNPWHSYKLSTFTFGVPNPSNVAFALWLAFLAGVGEELFFRGFLLHLVSRKLKNAHMANLIVTGIFAGFHWRGGAYLPIVPAIASLFLGYLTIRSDWNVSRASFVHMWADVGIFLLKFSIVGHK